jgi:hypothetical protein
VLVHLGGGAAYLAVRDAKWLEIGYDGVEVTMAAGKVRLDHEYGMLWPVGGRAGLLRRICSRRRAATGEAVGV